MNSSLYHVAIMHARLKPRKHKFTHRIFMFYLDLDEIDQLNQKMRLLSHNRFNLYNFCDCDHMQIGAKTIKENILLYLKKKGVEQTPARIMLLTNVRTLGYIFNPVCFYFCFNEKNEPICVVPEIGNTFGELKVFFIGPDHLKDGQFRSQQKKHYYVSPFVDLDVDMDFQIRIPNHNLEICIDSIKDGERLIVTSMLGAHKELSDANLLKQTIRHPMVTLKVIFLIHFHAVILWLKKVSYHRKQDNPQLQQEVLRVWSEN